MEEIANLGHLSYLVTVGETNWDEYGDVRAAYNGDLVIFNYTARAQFARRWNWFERVSRGLILNRKTGEVVARSFDKFFNWMEGDRKSDADIVSVTEKLDGSLGILYRDDGEFRIATRGSFDSDQALWATAFLREYINLDDLNPSYTLLFEIIYPENRIVLDYQGWSTLVLLAVRNRFASEFLPFPEVVELAERYRLPIPNVHQFRSVADIIAAKETLEASAEGWVVEFSDGQRFKFKGDRYFEVHRLLYHTTFRRTLEAIQEDRLEELVGDIPDEFLDQIRIWETEIKIKVADIRRQVEVAYAEAPKGTRKEFAAWVMSNYGDLSSYLFKKLDGHDYLPLIYQREF